MTIDERFERTLPDVLTDLYLGPMPDYRDALLTQAARTRQRPAWSFPGRWLPMADTAGRTTFAPRLPWRTIAVALLLIALLIAGLVAVIGSRQQRLPAPFGPAANGLIPYSSNGDIYAGDPSTGLSRRILAGDAIDIEPAFSRDGTRIAFQRQVDPNNKDVFRIMAMNADGTDVHVVTAKPLGEPHWWDWTPSGDIVVAASDQVIQDMTIYDGAGLDAPTTLTHGIDVDAPVFRPPDSREVLFRGRVGDKAGLYVMNADGTDLHQVIPLATSGNLETTLVEPRYSPDGSQIAFQQWDDASGRMRLYVMDANGGGRREVGARPDMVFTGWPVWSNDGKRIAATRARTWESGPGSLAVIDVATDQIVETGPPLPEGRYEWAPDDSSILLSWNDGTQQLLLDPAGGPATRLPWDAASYPSWQRLALP